MRVDTFYFFLEVAHGEWLSTQMDSGRHTPGSNFTMSDSFRKLQKQTSAETLHLNVWEEVSYTI